MKRDRVALGMICEREEARNKWEGNMRSQYLELCNEVLNLGAAAPTDAAPRGIDLERRPKIAHLEHRPNIRL